MKNEQVKLLHILTVPMSLIFLKDQLKFYKNNGFEVHILSSPGKLLYDFSREEGVKKHEVAMERDISLVNDIKALIKLIGIMRTGKFDIVHTHTPKASLLGITAAFIAGIKNRIYHMHGQVYVTKKGVKRKVLYLTEKITSLLATNVYAVSPSLKDFAIKEGITSEKKVKVVSNGSINGIDYLNEFNPEIYDGEKLRMKYNLSDNYFVMGFVGRLVKDKGIIELYRAWQCLQKKHINIKLLIVGDFEDDRKVPEDIIHDIKTNPDIIFLGFIKNPAPFYLLMDVLILPTYREGFGLVAIEASAMETPVIASNVVGCIDTVRDNDTGFLISPKSVNSIVEKVEFYINNTQKKIKHGRAGRQYIKDDYQQELIWNEMLNDYKDLIARR